MILVWQVLLFTATFSFAVTEHVHEGNIKLCNAVMEEETSNDMVECFQEAMENEMQQLFSPCMDVPDIEDFLKDICEEPIGFQKFAECVEKEFKSIKEDEINMDKLKEDGGKFQECIYKHMDMKKW